MAKLQHMHQAAVGHGQGAGIEGKHEEGIRGDQGLGRKDRNPRRVRVRKGGMI